MEDIVQSLLTQWVSAIVTFLLGFLWHRYRTLANREQNMEKGIRATLKLELRRIHEGAAKQGYITYGDEAIAEEIYAAYHALGGNGQGTAMINDLRKMEAK